MSSVRLTIVHDLLEAEVLCGLLLANGIGCWHRGTDVAAGAFGGLPTGWNHIEVLVDEARLEDARAFLAEPHDPTELRDS